jgi:hypothetical protein
LGFASFQKKVLGESNNDSFYTLISAFLGMPASMLIIKTNFLDMMIYGKQFIEVGFKN